MSDKTGEEDRIRSRDCDASGFNDVTGHDLSMGADGLPMERP